MVTSAPATLKDRLLGIQLPMTHQALAVYEALLAQTIARDEGEILLVTGDPGSGKSHLCKQFNTWATAHYEHLGRPRTCLQVLLETAANLQDLARQLAREAGNPVTLHKMLDKKTKDISFEVLDDLVRLRPIVILLDEGHNMLLAKKDSKSIDLARWLKNLTYKGVSFVIFGLPELHRTIASYEELASRLYRPEPLHLSGLPADSASERKAAIAFLSELQRAFDVSASPEFSDPRIVLPLMGVTGRDLRKILRVVQGAVNASLQSGDGVVTPAHFKRACELAGLSWVDEE